MLPTSSSAAPGGPVIIIDVLGWWFDPRRVRAEGGPPDYRFSLANERTFLAWLRTGLALVGGGLAVAQFLPAGPARTALALGLIGLGAVVAVRAVDNWARCERAIRLGQDLPPSRFPALLAIVVAAGAVTLAIAVAFGAFS
jgi:putative membrane protein